MNEANDYQLVQNKLRLIRCFFQPLNYSDGLSERVFFMNNTAGHAGSDLYGGWGDLCTIKDVRNNEIVKGNRFFNAMFVFASNYDIYSTISSNPTRVCVCGGGIPQCNITVHNVMAFPGEKIQILAVSVGQRFGITPSTVYAESEKTSNFEVLDIQHAQTTSRMCTNLTYTIRSASDVEMIKLVIDPEVDTIATTLDARLASSLNLEDMAIVYSGFGKEYRTFSDNRTICRCTPTCNCNVSSKPELDPSLLLPFEELTVNITLLACPPGFVLHNETCTCHLVLKRYRINCSIDNQLIFRKHPFWILSSTGGIIIHEHCPHDYCKSESFDLSLNNPEYQCAFQRSGLLCGECKGGLSQVFGTSNCKHCSSLWLLVLLPVAALAGVLLVISLMMLNLTVAVGTINGLVFYANIIKANEATFIPPEAIGSPLSVFIAWLNLDLGIEVCFYDGLDAFTKTWLQFAFPLYIWLIVIIIIVSSHYSTTVARLSGRNAVPVLATLFLLSYTKLLRTIITAFSFTFLEYPNHKTKAVWLYDANVDYLSGKHTALFIVALVILLALSIPFTVVLILVQSIQTNSNRCVLRYWVPRVKPLIDAFNGPYKDKHRYWTGLLLLLRFVLFVIFSTNFSGDPAINLLAIIVSVAYLFFHVALFGRIYRRWHLIALEYSFLLNLIIFSAATYYTRQSNGTQTVAMDVCIGTAAAVFVAILIFHVCTLSLPAVKKLIGCFHERMDVQRDCGIAQGIELQEIGVRQRNATVAAGGKEIGTLYLKFDDLREPVLEYCDT